ncbi:MAG: LPS export ABC transporter periplasmic protein LptC [Candidatus Accumulibacter sp.]|jgi:lipopolysaccharide export system protein LptC|nr:LPS export ABC transporter periplasmic protein LptC [Accumulibacter sp.]
MKHWGSALFPLSVLLVLTLLTFWLRYATELAEPNRDGKHRHDPDYLLNDIVLRRLDPNGQLKYTLRAADVRHYPDDDTTDLLKPNLVHQSRGDDKPPVAISADRGHVSHDNEQVDLYDNVRIYRPPSGKYDELVATTDKLTAFPDDETAFTKNPALITQGKSWVKGVGMQIDNRAQTYLIESQAVGFMESKRAGTESKRAEVKSKGSEVKGKNTEVKSKSAGAKGKSAGAKGKGTGVKSKSTRAKGKSTGKNTRKKKS